MRHLFILDPLDRLHVDGDSSIAFIREAWRRGHRVETCGVGDLGQRDGTPFAHTAVTTAGDGDRWYSVDAPRREELNSFDAVWMRKDPPVDAAYVFATQLMSRARGPVMVNDPQALRDENEKLFALEFADLCPATLVSSSIDELQEFRAAFGGQMVVKPLDGKGGEGVFHITKDDRNARALLEIGTAYGTRLLMAQQYVPDVRKGDKRILLIDGRPAGALLRVPADDDARANLHVGGQAKLSELTDQDREICVRVGPALREKGVILAGIDVLGTFLTEINITSPTGFREIERLGGGALEVELLDAVEARYRSRRAR
ncbi:MAG: glutathione synthase [Planctomycetes bacterium]|nr:glutathione synthase [Planctomycetota bacterium]